MYAARLEYVILLIFSASLFFSLPLSFSLSRLFFIGVWSVEEICSVHVCLLRKKKKSRTEVNNIFKGNVGANGNIAEVKRESTQCLPDLHL